MARRRVVARAGDVIDTGVIGEPRVVFERVGVPSIGKMRRGFAKVDEWMSPEDFLESCEEYFSGIDRHNAVVRKCATGIWNEKAEGRPAPFDAGDYLAYTHTGLALHLKLPSRVALAAVAGRGEAWAEVLDHVDLKIEGCLVDGMLSGRGKFRAEGCTAYLKQVLAWKGTKEGSSGGGKTQILIVNDPVLGQKLLDDPTAAARLLADGGASDDTD